MRQHRIRYEPWDNRDSILWTIIASFVGWEVYAKKIDKNQKAHTLSNRIWLLEEKFGWPARIGIAGAICVLASHLLFRRP